MTRDLRTLALIGALVVGVSGSAGAQSRARPASAETLPAGTVLKARLDQRLHSAEARVGDRFTATVLSDEDRSGLPVGTRVEGVIHEAKAASEEKPGVLDVEFTALRFSDGTVRTVSGSLNALDSKSVERTESGRLVSRKSGKSERAKFLGYGAGAGAVIGLLTGGNLLKSALLGAAGGFLVGELKSDKERNGGYSDVNLKAGSEFGVRLDQQFSWTTVAAYDGARYGDPISSVGSLPAMPSTPGARAGATGAMPAPAPRAGIGVLFDDREVAFGRALPTRAGKVLLVPAAPVFKAARRSFTYNSQTRQLTVNGARGVIRTTVGSLIAVSGAGRHRLAAPARFIQGTLYVPVQILELGTDRRAEWDESSKTLMLFAADAKVDQYQLRGTGF